MSHAPLPTGDAVPCEPDGDAVGPDAQPSKGNAEAVGFDHVHGMLIRDRNGIYEVGLVSRQLPVATLLLVGSRRGPSRPRNSLQLEKQQTARERPPIENPPKAVPGHPGALAALSSRSDSGHYDVMTAAGRARADPSAELRTLHIFAPVGGPQRPSRSSKKSRMSVTSASQGLGEVFGLQARRDTPLPRERRPGRDDVIEGLLAARRGARGGGRATAWKVDIIIRKARAFSQAEMARRTPATVLGVKVYVATAEDTVLAKLEWAKRGESERQLRDVRALVEARGDSLDRAHIETWLDDLGVRELWERVQD